jgi:hypothetical protein
VIGTTGADVATFQSGSLDVGASHVPYSSIDAVTFDGRGGWDALTVHGGVPIELAGEQRLQSLTLRPATSAFVSAGNGTLVVRDLQIGSASTLDLTDNDLLLDYGGATSYPTVRGYVSAGRNGGSQGITSTPAAADRVMAIADNSLFGRTAFNGIPIDATTIIGKYTYYGDGNLDGKVTGDDYLSVDANLGLTGAQWFQGDFNFDGKTTGDDYLAIDANLGKGTIDPLAFADEQEAMIEIHSSQFGGHSYVKAVEEAVKASYKSGPSKKINATRSVRAASS